MDMHMQSPVYTEKPPNDPNMPQGNVAQQPGGYLPPQQGGYPEPQQPGGYPPPQQGGYPQPQQPGGYLPPQQGGYTNVPTAQLGGSPPQQSAQPQPSGGYPPQQSGHPQQPGGYPQQQAGFVQQPGAYQQTVVIAQPVRGTPLVGSSRPRDYMTSSIIVCLCCFWPTGLAAIYYANRTNQFIRDGNSVEANRNSTRARNLMIISLVVGVSWIVLVIVLQVIAAQTVKASYNVHI